MAQPSVAREPSMEEILASIRRIIESNDPVNGGSLSQDVSALSDEHGQSEDDIAFDGGEAGVLGEFFRVADDGGHLVAALQGFAEDSGTDESGGADQGDFHVRLHGGLRGDA